MLFTSVVYDFDFAWLCVVTQLDFKVSFNQHFSGQEFLRYYLQHPVVGYNKFLPGIIHLNQQWITEKVEPIFVGENRLAPPVVFHEVSEEIAIISWKLWMIFQALDFLLK